jgi:hypothetical protein
MAGQQPCRPQLVRIAVLLGLVARQRDQPRLGLRRDYRLLARSRALLERRQCTVSHRPLDAALHGLMMDAKSLSYCKERRVLAVGKQHRGPRHPARRFGPRPRKNRQHFNLIIGHCQLDRLPPSRHDETPRSVNPKRGIHQQTSRSITAKFTESVV